MRRRASGSENVKANVALDIGQSVIERHRLAPSDEVAQAVLDDIVRQIVDVGVALIKDAARSSQKGKIARCCQPTRWASAQVARTRRTRSELVRRENVEFPCAKCW